MRLNISSSDFWRTFACLGFLSILYLCCMRVRNIRDELCSRILTHLLQVIIASPRTHSPSIVFVKNLISFL
jgi:hypothetical protein